MTLLCLGLTGTVMRANNEEVLHLKQKIGKKRMFCHEVPVVPGRQMKWLSDVYSALQILPSSLVDSEQSCALVLIVNGDDYACA